MTLMIKILPRSPKIWKLSGMVTNKLNLSTCVILSGKDLYLFYILLKLMVKYLGNPL